MFRSAALTVLYLSLSVLPTYAAEATVAEFTPFVTSTPVPSLTRTVDWTPRSTQFEKPVARPRALPALYVSLAALQAFDAYSTVRGLSRGAQEGNPFMQHVAGNTVGFLALKAATTAVPMILAERMWKHNKVGAIALMVAANGVAAAVGVNNAQALHQVR